MCHEVASEILLFQSRDDGVRVDDRASETSSHMQSSVDHIVAGARI